MINRAAGEREINWGCGNRCGEDLEFEGLLEMERSL